MCKSNWRFAEAGRLGTKCLTAAGKASNELEKEAEKSSNARQSETAATASPAAAPTIGLDSLKLTPSKQEQGE